MKFTSIKDARKITLEGISVTFDRTDDTLNSITFRDAAGKMVRVANRSFSLCVEVLAEPETETGFDVVGEIFGVTVAESFGTDYNHAMSRFKELHEKGGDVSVKEVQSVKADTTERLVGLDDLPF